MQHFISHNLYDRLLLAAAGDAAHSDGLMEIIFSGGWTGFSIVMLLAVLSMIALALGVEQLLTIRQSVLVPGDLAAKLTQLLKQGDLPGAAAACDAEPCFLSAVVQAGIHETESDWPAVEKAMEDATGEHAARLFRKVEYLSVIGNIAPMVGLLGTVVGMIFAFQEVANSQGAARAAELASGIYQALVTTVGGLIVAIPSLGAFAIFRNRVDQFVAEAAYAAQHAMLPIKRALQGRSKRPEAQERRAES